MDRRRHKRIDTSIPVRIHIQISNPPNVPWTSRGVLENISYEGAYFRSNQQPPIEPGQIRDFTITPIEQRPDVPSTTFIEGTCRVVRIDPSKTGSDDRGIAVEFISAKIFELLTKIS